MVTKYERLSKKIDMEGVDAIDHSVLFEKGDIVILRFERSGHYLLPAGTLIYLPVRRVGSMLNLAVLMQEANQVPDNKASHIPKHQ